MLVDSLLFTEQSERFSRQLLCVSSILFVIKLERDYNDNLGDFFNFLSHQLNLQPTDIKICENYILANVPAYFGLLVGFSEVLKSFSSILELAPVSKAEHEFLSNKVVETYIKADSKLSVEDLLIDALLKAYYPKKGAESKRKRLLQQLQHCRENGKRVKSTVDAKCKTVRLLAADALNSESTSC
jgi:hypothetical protein